VLPILAALLLAATDPAAAEPPSEALVDRFMTVIPDGDRLSQVDRTADPAELARLSRLNPDKAEAIRPVLEAYAACSSPINNAISESGLRFAAQQLGGVKLEQLIRFYEGEDFHRVVALTARMQPGGTLAPSEQAELERILATYPLAEFNALLTGGMPEFFAAQTDRIAALDRCTEVKQAALERLGVDTVGPIVTPVPPSPRDRNGAQVDCRETAGAVEPDRTCPARRHRER
jgi:hypothetical protein